MSKDPVVSALPTFREPVPDVIETLEALLERARKGEVRAVVACFEVVGEATGHVYAWGQRSLPMALVGELELAKLSVFISTGRLKPP